MSKKIGKTLTNIEENWTELSLYFKKKLLGITTDSINIDINEPAKDKLDLYNNDFKLLKKHGNKGFFVSLSRDLKSMIETPENHIGIIDLGESFLIENLIKNNNGYTYYRIHSKNNSILYNLFLLQYYHLKKKEPDDKDYKKFIDDNREKISDDSEFNSNKYCHSSSLEEKIKNLVNLCKTLSKIFVDYSFLLIQDNIVSDSSGIKGKNIILCADKEDLQNALKKNIVLLYFYISSTACNLEPIIIVNNKEEKIEYLVPENIIEQHKILFYNLSIFEDIAAEKQEEQNIQTSEYILFNPLDKNRKLPQIIIELSDSSKKKYLLGNKYYENTTDFYNIYEDDDKENNLAGKVNFLPNKELDVYWCVNHPKIYN